MAFPLRKIIIFRDEGRHYLLFRTLLRPAAGTLAHLFELTSAALDPKRVPCHLQLYALLLLSRRSNHKLSSLTLNSAPTV